MKAVFGILFVFALLFAPLMHAAEVGGVMMVVKGDIKVTTGKDGKSEAAKVGRKVFGGDTITAGPDSRAKIVMADKNILNISPDSKLTIEKYSNDPKTDSKNVELKVEYGKVRATVVQKYDGEKNKFNIKTPTAVAGVRGTDFMASFNSYTRQTSVVTFTGSVAVGKPGPGGKILNPVFVQPGQSTSMSEGKNPEAPKPVPKEELSNMKQESSADTAQKDAGSSSGSKEKGDAKEEKDEKDKKEDKKEDSKKDEKRDDKKEDKKDDAKKDEVKKDEPKKDEPKKDQAQTNSEPEPKQDAKQKPKKEPKPDQQAGQESKGGSGERGPTSIAPLGGDAVGGSVAGGTPTNVGGQPIPPSDGMAVKPEIPGPASVGPSPGGITGLPALGGSVMRPGDLPSAPGGSFVMPSMPKIPFVLPTQLAPVAPAAPNQLINQIVNQPTKVNTTITISK